MRMKWRILVLARLVTTNFSQSFDGFWFGDVRMSIVSPFLSA